MKSVAIIGCGPSGLVSCKSALESGLMPTVFERNVDVGGVWSQSSGRTWDAMHTNLSYNTMSFSDFPWEDDWHTGDFPIQSEMSAYLERYADHFNLRQHIKFQCNVTFVHQDKDKQKWFVEYSDRSGEKLKLMFDFVIVATGLYDKQPPPNIKNLQKFTGSTSYGCDYKNPHPYRGKSVLVVGDSNSGCEIATELAESPDINVTQLRKRPSYVIGNYIPNLFAADTTKTLPFDMVYYSRDNFYKIMSQFQNDNERNLGTHQWAAIICKKQLASKHMSIEPSVATPYITISDKYPDTVLQGKIEIKDSLTDISGKSIYFSSKDDCKEIDHIIFAHGYTFELPFFDQSVLKDIDYNPSDKLLPIVLHKATIHPTISTIGFVGWYNNAMFPVIELQARWLLLIASGQLAPPTKAQIEEGMKSEREIRDKPMRMQFPHGAMIDLADSIASQIGALPDFEKIKEQDPHLYKMIFKNFTSPASYRLIGPYSNTKLATQMLNDIDNKYYK